jgi:hypothetical protein
MVSDDTGSGLLGPVFEMQRSLVQGGLGVQRRVAEDLQDRIESLEDLSRRTRLSSHYTAVRAVDQLEEIHPDEEASLDPLYDGVGRTFEALATVDDGAATAAADTIETVADVADEAGERYLDASETTCEPLVEGLDDTEPAAGDYGPAADD